MAVRSSEENWERIESLDPQKQKEILQRKLQDRKPIRSFLISLRSSAENWKWIESLDPQRQRDILQWKLQVRKPIRRFTDIKLGDHLVTKGSILWGLCEYEHHCVCINFDKKGSPIIIHYFNTTANACLKMLSTASFYSGASLGKVAKIQMTTLKEKNDLINEDKLQGKDDNEWAMARVVWPDELRRLQYSVEEIIMNSEEREGENSYHLANNNCESFVMWCLCGLNISLQVTPPLKESCEVGSTVLREMLSQIPKICVDFAYSFPAVCRFLARINVPLPKVLKNTAVGNLGAVIGVVLIVVFETVSCAKNIHAMYKDWQGPKALIKSKKDFFMKVADRVLLTLFRSGGSIGGKLAGQLWATFFLASLRVSSPLAFILCSNLAGLVGAMLGALAVQEILAKTFSDTNAMDQTRSSKSITELLKSIIWKRARMGVRR